MDNRDNIAPRCAHTLKSRLMDVDPLLKALLLYKRNKVDEAIELCTAILDKDPYDQAAWGLKMTCMTEGIYVDEIENDERGVAETFLDDSVIASNARPGTSFSRPLTSSKGPSQAIRPRSSTGRPLSGVVRPDTTARPGTMEQSLRTSRTSKTARATSSSSARFVRLGTASMVSQSDGPFINLARLNVEKYARDPNISRLLFEYIAAIATKSAYYSDWYWKNQLGKCYYRLGMFSDAIKQFLSSLNNQKMVETYALLAKTYNRIDQPMMAIEQYNSGLHIFRNDVTLLIGLARVYEQLGEMEKSVDTYKAVLKQDASNVEAIACVATNYFYSDQPEIALRYYRRILQMGVNSAELFMNLGLCCFFCQQFDLSMSCVERALSIATDDVVADTWYNTGNILLATGDTTMASRCYRLAMAADPNHAESVCNLAVLQMRDGKLDQSRALFLSATQKGPHLFEPHFNLALLTYQLGQFDESRSLVLKALEIFPDHVYSKTLLGYIEQMYTLL
ncbi:Tetratricopeptide repeat protein 8 [Toxocara canis]|uniref:Tetratricopeptide repeat protein 8 n=1 Tax=Toxocara canis TaxID=6265 RepID=A0A0B2VVD3_TOXCA|nr:Tetratricopeptide repeat protein 8 [Toxocara canis]